MRGVHKLAVTLTAAALLAAALVACGGGDSTDSTATSTAATTAPAKPAGNAGGDSSAKLKKDGSGGSSDSSNSGGGSTSSDEGSASFRTPGGDNSIQDFGDEADSSEREEASAALTAFLDARAKGDYAAQCDNLAKAATEPLEELAARSPKVKSKGCAGTLEALTAGAPASTRVSPMTAAGVAALRIEGDRGFALFHGSKGSDYFVPMAKEGGQWKVGAIGPSEFP